MRLFAVTAADPPVHAPASIARATFAEQIFQRVPQIGSERMNAKLHH
jgi:hypothetical protein